MRRSIWTITAIIACMEMNAQSNFLEPFRWEKRILLLYAAQAHDEQLLLQWDQYAGAVAEDSNRDLRVFRVSQAGILDEQGNRVASLQDFPYYQSLSDKDFEVILIGKDGGIKLIKNNLLPNTELFAIIDRMPMRMEEMRRQNRK